MNKPTIPFEPWPKLPRFRREVVITEKIDGTNAGILIGEYDPLTIHASSRTRWITPEDDNAGFARWVDENSATLIEDLGPGMHFGEWWGKGIQRNYGLDHKRFSLFNTSQWGPVDCGAGLATTPYPFKTPNIQSVPVIAQGMLNDDLIDLAVTTIRYGSLAAPGFKDAEGICIFHVAANKSFKFTLDGDGHKDYRG